MDRWARAKDISAILSGWAIPIVLLVLGSFFNSALKEREVQGKFVELAVAILKEPPSDQTRPLRTWAVQVVDKYSGVPLGVESRGLLLEKLSLPLSATPSTIFSEFSFPVASRDSPVPALTYLGYYKFDLTDLKQDYNPGRHAERVADATRAFQKDHGLPVTGVADRPTLDALWNEAQKKLASKGFKK